MSVTLPKDQFEGWKREIGLCERRRQSYLDAWQRNVKAYAGFTEAANDDNAVYVNKAWPRVRQKISSLFFKVPEVVVLPRHPKYAPAAPVYGLALNDMLDRRMDVATTVDDVLTDMLSASGIGVSCIGYDAVMETITVDVPMDTGQVDPLSGQPITVPIPTEQVVPLHEEWYWDRISPALFMWPASFTGSDWDKAPWLGYEFSMPRQVAIERFKLPKDFKGVPPKKDDLLSQPKDDAEDGEKETLVRGWEIWYWAHLFDAKIKHPWHQRRLVILDGMDDKPALHEDSPYQRYDPMTRKWMGVTKRLPIRVLSLTRVPDCAIPPSETEISRPQLKELARSRTTMMAQRERSLPVRWYDVNAVDEEATDILRHGNLQEWLPMNGPADRAIGEISRANYPRENFTIDTIIEQDLNEVWAVGPNQMGADTVGRTTAREVNAMESALAARLDYERSKVLRWFVHGAEMVGALMQMFHDDTEFVEVVGEDGLRRMESWDRQRIQGEFAFKVKPDTSVRLDIGREREDSRNLYNHIRRDPMVNGNKVLERVLTTHGVDPFEYINQKPPEPKPDPANVSYRFSGDDLSPLNPAFPIVVSILQQNGIQLDPRLIEAMTNQARQQQAMQLMAPSIPPQPGQQEHGGMAEKADILTKHGAEGKAL